MQCNRTLRRKIKRDLYNIQLLNSNSNTIEIEEIADTSHIMSLNISTISNSISHSSQNSSASHEITSNSSKIEITKKYDLDELKCNSAVKDSNCDLLQISSENKNQGIDNNSFKDDLCRWVVECNIPQSTVNKLLHLMKQRDIINTNELPWDCRKLLGTPRTVTSNIRVTEPGHYFHFGLAEGIIRHATPNLSEIQIMIGIDGLPIAKSSNSQLWPILAYIINTTKTIFPVGVYHGYAKPNNSNNFLDDFISEAKDLIANGIVLFNCKKKVSFTGFICNSPAKAFILNLKGHSGFSSCTRCIQVGEYYKNRVCYPYCDFSLKRTHETYVNKTYDEHHIGDTLSRLIEIPSLDVVNMFPLGYMHLVALGVVKKLILLWLHTGPVHTRIPSRKINILNSSLLNIKSFIPTDFPRKTRVIQDFARYKASEFRFFVLYVGPIVLKNIIVEDSYTNFMALHVALIILLSPDYKCYLNYANELLHYFVKTFEAIYGRQHISHNVHGLLHLSDDYERFGPLDNCSAFPFENFMKELKSKIRKHDKPLEQIINRYKEMYQLSATCLQNDSKELPILSKQHMSGPLVDNIKGLQFKHIVFSKFKINTLLLKDSYILTNQKEIVQCLNIVKTDEGNIILIGKAFEKKKSLYEKPVDSAMLNIYIVQTINNKLTFWNYLEKEKKMMIIKHNGILVAMPIIHTD